MRGGAALLGCPAACACAPGAAHAQDFRNVLPAGQGETVDAVELAQAQATGEPPRSARAPASGSCATARTRSRTSAATRAPT